MKTKNLNNKNYKKGAALVEFAIMSTVLIPLLLYVTFFSELIQFRMKVDEMGYFAAWELAAYGMSNYSGNAYKDATSQFNSHKKEIQKRTYKLYRNFDSADPARSIGYLMITPDIDSLNVDMKKTSAIIKNSVFNKPPDKPNGQGGSAGGIGFDFNKLINGVDSFLQQGVNFVLGKAFGFNVDAIGSTTTASAGFNISERMKNHTDSDTSLGFSNARILREDGLGNGNLATYKSSPFTVWTDTWSVKQGGNINNTDEKIKCQDFWGSITGCADRPYARQVNRMSLLGTWSVGKGVRIALNIVGSGIIGLLGQIPYIGKVFGADEDVSQARVVSMNYYYNSDPHGTYTATGVSKGQKLFHTTPLVYRFRGPNFGNESDDAIKAYRDTLEKRRNFYMGNDKPNCRFDGLHENCQ